MTDHDITTLPTVTAEAAEVAAAEAVQAAAEVALIAAKEDAGPIQQRLADIGAKRAEIAARRAAGDKRETDAGDLAVLDLDAAELQKLVAVADAVVVARHAERTQAAAALATARDALARAEAAAQLGALVDHAVKLEGLFDRTLAAIGTLEQRLGHVGRPSWVPSRGFYDAMRRHASAGGIL